MLKKLEKKAKEKTGSKKQKKGQNQKRDSNEKDVRQGRTEKRGKQVVSTDSHRQDEKMKEKFRKKDDSLF